MNRREAFRHLMAFTAASPLLGQTAADDVNGGERHSERSACMTSTLAARAAGMHDAMMAAAASTAAALTTGTTPGSCTCSTN